MKKTIKINLTEGKSEQRKSSVQAKMVGEELRITGLDAKLDKLTYLCCKRR